MRDIICDNDNDIIKDLKDPIIEELDTTEDFTTIIQGKQVINFEKLSNVSGYRKKIKKYPLDMQYKCSICGFIGIIPINQHSCPGCPSLTDKEPLYQASDNTIQFKQA